MRTFRTKDGVEHTVVVRRDGSGYWTLYVDDRPLIERESFTVADRVADELATPTGRYSEAGEVAASIMRWLTTVRASGTTLP